MSKKTDPYVAALQELGDTPEAVAASLKKLGHAGRTLDLDRCALNRYLRQKFPDVRSVQVSAAHVQFDRVQVILPDPVADFVPRYDRREWPELIAA